MNTILATYLEFVALDKSQNTVRSYTKVLGDFEKFITVDILDATSTDIQAYVSHKGSTGVKKSTLNQHIRAIKAFYASMALDGRIEKDPAKNIRLLKEPVREVVTITDDEFGAMLSACRGSQERLMLQMLRRTGLRAAEMVSIKMSDIHDCKVTFIGKGNKQFTMPLTETVCDALTEWKEERKVTGIDSEYLLTAVGHKDGITTRALSHRIKELARKAGLPDDRVEKIHTHTLRASFITGIAAKHGGLVAQHAARHASQNTTKLYINTMALGIEEAILSQG